MKKDGVVILNEYIESLRKLSREELGTLMMAVLDNAAGEQPDLNGASLTVEILYPIFQASIDRIRDVSEQKSYAGKQGGRSKKSSAFENEKAELSKNEKPEPNRTEPNQTSISPVGDAPARAKRFIPPTAAEVKAFAEEKEIAIDAERFVDFYASKGWLVGKTPMKDWKAAVRNWASKDKPPSEPKSPVKPDKYADVFSNYGKYMTMPDSARKALKEASG